RDAPLALRRGLPALDEQHPIAVEDHRAHPDAGGVGILAGEGHRALPRAEPGLEPGLEMVRALMDRPARVQRSVPYFSRTSASARSISGAESPPGESSRPWTSRK